MILQKMRVHLCGWVVILLYFWSSRVTASVLYANTFIARKGEVITLTTVKIGPSGNITYIADDVSFWKVASMYPGVSAFDQKRNILYYNMGFHDSNVYGVNVVTGTSVGIIRTFVTQTSTLVYDNVRDQLLMTLRYDFVEGVDEEMTNNLHNNRNYLRINTEEFDYVANISTNILVSVSGLTGAMKQVTNFTLTNVSEISHAAISQSGIYYFTYKLEGTPYFGFGSFNLSNPNDTQTLIKFPCKGVEPYYIYYNEQLSEIIGVGSDTSFSYNYYFQINDGICKITLLQYVGGFSSVTYDPTSATFYMASGFYLATFVVVKAPVVTLQNLEVALENLEVAYY